MFNNNLISIGHGRVFNFLMSYILAIVWWNLQFYNFFFEIFVMFKVSSASRATEPPVVFDNSLLLCF